MPKKTHGLARGVDSLLPEVDMMTSGGGQESAIGDIDPNPDQPRRAFSEESIAQLAQSIREQGLLQPILVVPMNGGRYRIVAGERRWRAARMAGLDRVPCIIREMDVPTQMEIALVENLQREDLNPIEAAQGIQTLMRQCGYTQEAVAARLCKSRGEPAASADAAGGHHHDGAARDAERGSRACAGGAGIGRDEDDAGTADDYERVERPTAGKRGRADAQEHPDAAQNTTEGAFSACGADGAGNVLPRDVRRSRDDYRQSEEGQNHAAVLLGGGAGAGL